MSALLKQARAFAVCCWVSTFLATGCGRTGKAAIANSPSMTHSLVASISPDGVSWQFYDDAETTAGRVIPEMTVARLSELILSECSWLTIRISANPNTEMKDVFRVVNVILRAGCSLTEFGVDGTSFRVVWGRIGAYPREYEGEPILLHMVRSDSSQTETVLVIAVPADSPSSPSGANPDVGSVSEQWLVSGDCTAGYFIARLHNESVSPTLPHVDALFATDNAASFQKMAEGWPPDSLEPDSKVVVPSP